MNPSLSIATGLCLTAFASQCYATVNLQGTYSGTIRTVNSNCSTPAHNGNWSQPFTIQVIQTNGKIDSLPTTITDPLTGVSTTYLIANGDSDIDGKKANIWGDMLANFVGGGKFIGSFHRNSGYRLC